MKGKGLESALVPLNEIVRLPKNAKSHDIGAISVSLGRWGFLERLIVNRRTGHLLSGHGRLDTLLQAKSSGAALPVGLEERNGTWLVPVDYVDMAEDQEMPAAIALNRTVELGGWDEALLAPILADLAKTPEGLAGVGFDDDDVDRMLRDLQSARTPAAEPEPEIDKAAELQKKWGTEVGQLWQIGVHRLICGSCLTEMDRLLDGAKVDLVLTDPPYGVDIKYAAFDDSAANTRLLINQFLPLVRRWPVVLLTSGVRCLWDYPRPDWLLAWVHPAGMGCGPWGFTGLNPILAYGKDPYLARGLGSRPDTLVLAADREGVEGHPVIKPIKVWTWLLERGSPSRGEFVLDPFCGSGTSLVAAEQLGRIGFACELDPGYTAVALQRLADMGLKPELVSA